MNFGRMANETHYQLEDVLTRNIMTYDNVTQLDEYVKRRRNYILHPLFTKTDKVFNVSLFHCPPHVVKLDQRMTMDSYDGVEFQFLKEIFRGWTVNIFDRSFLVDSGDIYEKIAADVANRRTMMGMCSMWLTSYRYNQLDLSDHFSYLCGTFLVPKPKPMTQASYIYLPLSSCVWIIILVTLLATTLLYFLMYPSKAKDQKMEVFFTAFLDIINIVTSHGLPKVVKMIPLRLLIISWILLSLLLGTAYTTKYTSNLTKPTFTKPVDTIKDFLDKG